MPQPDSVYKVSAIMAVHNGALTLGAAIDSIRSQSLQQWELIVVDDASTDGTADILGQYGHDSRIKVITLHQNVGAGNARNVALETVRSRLVAIADADDLSRPQRFEAQERLMSHQVEVDVCGSQMEEFGSWSASFAEPLVSSWPTSRIEIEARIKSLKMPIPHPTMMLRTDKIRAVGGYPEGIRRAEDYGLLLRLRGAKFFMLDEILVDYRTTRPLPLSYAMVSGRDALTARKIEGLAAKREIAFPLLVDGRSVAQWIKRRSRER
ncbi:glycosyltransferase family 2 protein [Rhodococcus sp. IEGM 1343]|uniref:glycosyltransferase family 2 protein n=1 Tax=Rhodococcus sp. IEGM 1343 TaxID=3082224 RepID=UPI002954FF6C|nr:glycosyltransferase [Rhodococcus sp. IEGM 1343]MDV8055979.1 glycosyltransferase [Rhodococcus sp. IEGM 1343]